jgi:hypothetical protein
MARRARNTAAELARGDGFTPTRAVPREIVLDRMILSTDLPEVFPTLEEEVSLLETFFADLIDQALLPPE